jgi:hypothetical protein
VAGASPHHRRAAFLLQVITNEGVAWWARLVVLVAGMLATIAAALSLLQLRKREVEYSTRIVAFGIQDGGRRLRGQRHPLAVRAQELVTAVERASSR